MNAQLKNAEKTVVIRELQRKRSAVDQLQRKLNSYKCVPQTFHLFEKMAVLKEELVALANNTSELVATLQINDIVIVDYMENVELQFSRFNVLHNEIEDYIKSSR
ncbi:hypothetical protein [Aurantibacter sp.]|uniref:hypothetical protein n=1 Tax=Aurantibacter sp. TaxID=2807103 RepID=UPI003267B013